jgi:hypothetical protein
MLVSSFDDNITFWGQNGSVIFPLPRKGEKNEDTHCLNATNVALKSTSASCIVTKEIDMEAMEARRRGGPSAPVVLLLVAAALPAAAAFGFGAAPTGGLGRPACLRSSCAARQRPMLRAAIRMDRKDGGADKISKPGTSKPGGAPGKGAGGGGAGERESEGGGAGVAVLTKPPDVDKVSLSPRACWPFAPAVCACVDVCVCVCVVCVCVVCV